jgi:hypothetical protein
MNGVLFLENGLLDQRDTASFVRDLMRPMELLAVQYFVGPQRRRSMEEAAVLALVVVAATALIAFRQFRLSLAGVLARRMELRCNIPSTPA